MSKKIKEPTKVSQTKDRKDPTQFDVSSSLYFRSLLNDKIFYKKLIFGLGLIIVAQSVGITSILSFMKPERVYIEFSNSKDNFYKVYPAAEVRPESETGVKLTRAALRKYVYNRHKKDHVGDDIRAREVWAMSAPAEQQAFRKEFDDMKKNLEDTEREIRVVSDSILEKSLHQIEFETIDEKAGMKVVQSWIATIRFEFKPTEVNTADELINPLGIYVSKYSISKRETTNQEKEAE